MGEKGVIEIVRIRNQGLCSRIFLVPNTENRWEPVISLSSLYSHIPCPTFKKEITGYILRSVQKSQWLTYLDIKGAYFPSIQIAEGLLDFVYVLLG
jgi:hypothetical protein